MPRKGKILAKVLVSLLLLIFLFSRMEVGKFLGILSSANLFLLLLAALTQIASFFLSVVRWRLILRSFEVGTAYLPLLKITFIGSFFNLFLPTAIGGDFVRAYYLSRKADRSVSTTLTTILLDRSAGLCALLAIGTVCALVYPIKVQGVSLFHVFFLLSAAYALANVVLFHSWMQGRLSRFLSSRRLENVREKLDLVCEGLNRLRRSTGVIFTSLVLSLGIQFLSVGIIWIAAQAIDIHAPFRVFLIFVPAISLSIMFPLTINGLGLREGLYYLLFSQIGLPVETSVSLALLHFVIVLAAAAPGSVIYFVYKQEEGFPDLLAKAETP